MVAAKDWSAWHESYTDDSSPLSRRLRLIRGHIASWLDERTNETLRVVSVCAGQGHDLLGVLSNRSDADRVGATLLECDERNVAAAQDKVSASGLSKVTVAHTDAGDLAAYVGAVPADLVLMAGVFGNISDADVARTIAALPQLCNPGATVIWTRHRREPDLTPRIRRWLTDANLVERAFHAPEDVLFSVGVHRYVGNAHPLTSRGQLFQFLT